MSPHNNLCTQHLHRMVLTFSQQSPDIGPWLGQYPSWKMIKNQETQSKIIFAAFSSVFWDPYRDMNNRTGDMKTRKPFGNRSDYVQITFNCVQLAQKLRNFYVKNQVFFDDFWGFRFFTKIHDFKPKKREIWRYPNHFSLASVGQHLQSHVSGGCTGSLWLDLYDGRLISKDFEWETWCCLNPECASM